ncbi:Hypothetical protein CAP_7961 [Chondromyces apiculatus DSM 436]|uniref:Uncharacterized protein n=1 Tax=Chondromyces apiculatus DSM 436 TaxID=1192034 RepID=A0A017SY13_9BACT|nr:Hypothetical protein CAP_7961 [Chondromyces apiculatus DSM 436]
METVMLLIREPQIAAFAELAVADFEDRMVTHLRQVFPEACGSAPEPALRERIQRAITRAGRFGVVREYDVCLYLQVMVVKGDGFDEAPEHAALRAILEDERQSASVRVDHVHALVFSAGETRAGEA